MPCKFFMSSSRRTELGCKLACCSWMVCHLEENLPGGSVPSQWCVAPPSVTGTGEVGVGGLLEWVERDCEGWSSVGWRRGVYLEDGDPGWGRSYPRGLCVGHWSMFFLSHKGNKGSGSSLHLQHDSWDIWGPDEVAIGGAWHQRAVCSNLNGLWQ